MNHARHLGNSVGAYSTEFDERSQRHLALIGEAREALNTEQFQLYYQPKLDLRRRQVTGVEALVRWQHPQHGFVSPAEFIPVIEQTALIGPFTLAVLNLGIRQAAAWAAAGVDLKVSLNLSARNLLDAQLPEQIEQLLRVWSLPASRIVLEITESALMNPTASLKVIASWMRLGAGLSIDDYGTGYSSLSFLARAAARRAPRSTDRSCSTWTRTRTTKSSCARPWTWRTTSASRWSRKAWRQKPCWKTRRRRLRQYPRLLHQQAAGDRGIRHLAEAIHLCPRSGPPVLGWGPFRGFGGVGRPFSSPCPPPPARLGGVGGDAPLLWAAPFDVAAGSRGIGLSEGSERRRRVAPAFLVALSAPPARALASGYVTFGRRRDKRPSNPLPSGGPPLAERGPRVLCSACRTAARAWRRAIIALSRCNACRRRNRRSMRLR